MYIETSYPRLNREAARLISPEISNADGNCLSFYFHMYGLNIRELSVYSQSHSGSRTLLWRQQGELGDVWHLGSVALYIPNDSTIKVKYLSIIAIECFKRLVGLSNIFRPDNLVPCLQSRLH